MNVAIVAALRRGNEQKTARNIRAVRVTQYSLPSMAN
jgi:hypothetical protein